MKDVILIVEDETNIRANIAEFLQAEDFETLMAKDGEEAIAIFDEQQPDLVILDLMLPKVDGLEVCKHIRRDSDVPIIMVTARDEEIDKLLGLELGADDYITKPFSLRELKARIKAVLRRTKSGSGRMFVEEILTFGTLEVDIGRREVKQHGEIIDLTPSEYAILVTLCQNVGRPYSRLQLLNATLGESYAGYERAIDTHVSNLRKKIEPNPQKPIYILTVYGLGYKFGDRYETNQ
ncbi:MAG: response regulator transcription factor [Peptococcaceae bacterium]|nr:response regulator transcription factor [Peptococcaceae bacterium]MBR2627690.1 response regulator transcription factor [Peptococcaceae bacterium]